MEHLLKFPEGSLFAKPKSRGLKDSIYGKAREKDYVESVEWIAQIKPSAANVSAVKNKKFRYEEISVFCLSINNMETVYGVCRALFKKIKYPSLVILRYGNRYLLGACPFTPGKLDYSNNILGGIVLSHYLFPEKLSAPATDFIKMINEKLNSETDIPTIYTGITEVIRGFHIDGIKNRAKAEVKSKIVCKFFQVKIVKA